MDRDKKDLTGVLDLQKIQAENPDPTAVEIPVDPFAINELSTIEQVDSFDSIDQIGMMDHPSESAAPALPTDDPFAIDFKAPPEEETVTDFSTNLKNYSEETQGKTTLEVKIHYPFHLKLSGVFGPYERDKLLLFITENPIGLSSSELDLQIQANKVFLPRISEYAAIKLVQELRDSGLSFQLQPSDQDGDETTNTASALSFHYQNGENTSKPSALIEIPILNLNTMPTPLKAFEELDEVSIVQFVKTEVMEIENSPMIQEVIERMTEVLKQKARLKGGNALLNLKKEILHLRLPSQYQISLKASVIKL